MPKVLKKSMQLPGNFQGVGVREVSTEKLLWRWVFSGARRLCIVSSFDKVCNDITMFLYRAKCEGRCAKKQWSGDHVC